MNCCVKSEGAQEGTWEMGMDLGNLTVVRSMSLNVYLCECVCVCTESKERGERDMG